MGNASRSRRVATGELALIGLEADREFCYAAQDPEVKLGDQAISPVPVLKPLVSLPVSIKGQAISISSSNSSVLGWKVDACELGFSDGSASNTMTGISCLPSRVAKVRPTGPAPAMSTVTRLRPSASTKQELPGSQSHR